MRTGQIAANLVKLNEVFKLSYIEDLVAQKTAGTEKCTLENVDVAFHTTEYERLTALLEQERGRSELPEEGRDRRWTICSNASGLEALVKAEMNGVKRDRLGSTEMPR